jgi:GTP-binding protein HflX
MSTRLIRGWTHLERQKGGIGLRGPGETQLETDRRLLRARIKQIMQRLEKVGKQREQGRRARQRAEVPTVSLAGYTNAGKSTLFNRMTESTVYAADQLFATLDPTLRKIDIDDVGKVILADTVGFIRHLPHDLVAAFKATLTETREAQLLLHVIDCSDERMAENVEQVEVVLDEIGAGETPFLQVFNKVDQHPDMSPRIERDENGLPQKVWVSALTGEGLPLLYKAISERLVGDMVNHTLRLPPSEGRLRSRLYQLDCVAGERLDDEGNIVVDIRLDAIAWQRLDKQFDHNLDRFIAQCE